MNIQEVHLKTRRSPVLTYKTITLAAGPPGKIKAR
jgi:hypothetical protein